MHKSRRRTRHKCARAAAELPLPEPFNLRTLCNSLGAARRRPIQLCPMPMPADAPSGIWVATSTTDYICYESQTSALQRIHIVLHEISHLVLDHHPQSVMSDHTSRVLFPDLDPDLVRSVMNRSHYSATEEREAEILASLIARRAGLAQPMPDDELDGSAARVSQSLEGP